MAINAINSFFPSQVVSDQEKFLRVTDYRLVERFKTNGFPVIQGLLAIEAIKILFIT